MEGRPQAEPSGAEARSPYGRLELHVWSGTGNTYRVAEWMREEAEARGASVRLDRMARHGRTADVGDASSRLVGVLTPTHGFTAPWHAIRHVCRMPRGGGSDAFVLATRAGTKAWGVHIWGMEGTTCFLLALLLLARGYRPRGSLGLDMPSNWLALHSAMRAASVETIVARAEAKARRFIGRLLDGRRAWSGWICLVLGLALLPVSAGYLLQARFLLAKLFFASRRCNGCGLCAASCSVGGIRMMGDPPRPHWTYWCESCMRCMAFCPQQAVEASQSWAVLYYYAASALPAWLLARFVADSAALAWLDVPWLRFILSYAWFLAAIALAYLLLNALARRPLVNRLFTATTFTTLYRRYHAPGTRLADVAGRTDTEEGNHPC